MGDSALRLSLCMKMQTPGEIIFIILSFQKGVNRRVTYFDHTTSFYLNVKPEYFRLLVTWSNYSVGKGDPGLNQRSYYYKEYY